MTQKSIKPLPTTKFKKEDGKKAVLFFFKFQVLKCESSGAQNYSERKFFLGGRKRPALFI